MPATRQLGVLPMLGLWAGLCLTGTFYATWHGYGGREFAATLTAFAFFFLVMLLFAARGVADGLAARFGPGGGIALGAAAFLAYLIYGLGTNTFSFARAGAAGCLVFVPMALTASAERKPGGTWQDFLTLAGVWVAVKFWAIALAVAVSGRAPRLCIHRAARGKCCAGGVLTAAALGWNRLFHWLGTKLGTLRSWQLRRVWMYCHSAGYCDAFHRVRAAMACVVFIAVHFAGDFLFYGLAGGISISRVAAKYAVAIL